MTKNQRKNYILIAVVVAGLNFQSCKKYDDGPGLSFRSAQNRLTGEWEVVEVSNMNLSGYTITMEFEKDGDLTISNNYSYGGNSYSYSEDGEWSFEDKKKTLELEFDNSSEEFEILRLTNKELWFEDEDGNEWELEKE